MKIESIHLKNFRMFRDVSINQLPNCCVFVGANGTGKTSLFKDWLNNNNVKNSEPDKLTNASQELGKLVKNYEKRRGARAIAPHLE